VPITLGKVLGGALNMMSNGETITWHYGLGGRFNNVFWKIMFNRYFGHYYECMIIMEDFVIYFGTTNFNRNNKMGTTNMMDKFHALDA